MFSHKKNHFHLTNFGHRKTLKSRLNVLFASRFTVISRQRDTCIKVLIWPTLKPKTENCFSPIHFIGLLEE